MPPVRLALRALPALAAVVLLLPAAAPPAAAAELSEHLAPFEPLVGKTWKGELAGAPGRAEGAPPVYDVSRWEAALAGTAIRILHALSDGSYGGETLIVWDAKKESLVFFYFTTGGFYTTGTMEVAADGRSFTSVEEVTGAAPEGITAVEAVGELLPDGRLKSSSRYEKNGEWTAGHTIVYEEAPDARVELDRVGERREPAGGE